MPGNIPVDIETLTEDPQSCKTFARGTTNTSENPDDFVPQLRTE